MLAALDYLAAVYDQNLVGVYYSGQPVRDDEASRLFGMNARATVKSCF